MTEQQRKELNKWGDKKDIEIRVLISKIYSRNGFSDMVEKFILPEFLHCRILKFAEKALKLTTDAEETKIIEKYLEEDWRD